jgi:hypothetical protein
VELSSSYSRNDGDEAIQSLEKILDCVASLAMTAINDQCRPRERGTHTPGAL